MLYVEDWMNISWILWLYIIIMACPHHIYDISNLGKTLIRLKFYWTPENQSSSVSKEHHDPSTNNSAPANVSVMPSPLVNIDTQIICLPLLRQLRIQIEIYSNDTATFIASKIPNQATHIDFVPTFTCHYAIIIKWIKVKLKLPLIRHWIFDNDTKKIYII